MPTHGPISAQPHDTKGGYLPLRLLHPGLKRRVVADTHSKLGERTRFDRRARGKALLNDHSYTFVSNRCVSGQSPRFQRQRKWWPPRERNERCVRVKLLGMNAGDENSHVTVFGDAGIEVQRRAGQPVV
jgi:hypothetical protein